MQCPIAEEIKVIRGSGLYPGDLSDAHAIVLGSGETVVSETARGLAMICRLEHLRFVTQLSSYNSAEAMLRRKEAAEEADKDAMLRRKEAAEEAAKEAARWWKLRYAEFAGRPLDEILREALPRTCAAQLSVQELSGLIQEIYRAILRLIAVGALPSRVSISAADPAETLGSCEIPKMYRGLKDAVRFAETICVGSLKIRDPPRIPEDCPREEASPPWNSSAVFPTLDEANPLASCNTAAQTLLGVYEHAVIIEEQQAELARAAAGISRKYLEFLRELASRIPKK